MQRGLYFKGADRCELGEDRMERNGAICYLVGAGRLCGPHFSPEKEDLVIAADGGYTHLQELGIRTDLLIGDMDSLSGAVPEGVRVLPFKPEKNDTDMALSAAYALTEGFQRIRIYGGSGGRFDHTLANLQLLVYLSRAGADAILYEESAVITAVTNGCLKFPAGEAGYLSVFAHGGCAEGVWERGLKYQLKDALLRDDVTLGVSNEFTGEAAEITVRCGTLIVVRPLTEEQKRKASWLKDCQDTI